MKLVDISSYIDPDIKKKQLNNLEIFYVSSENTFLEPLILKFQNYYFWHKQKIEI